MNSACPSGDEKVTLFGQLIETNARLSRAFAVALEEGCDLPLAWFEVLLQLRMAEDGRLKMAKVADAIVHSTGGTTRLIDRLEESGLVERQNCPNDRRATYVALTNLGNKRLDEALGIHLQFLDETLATRLCASERRELSALLTKLNVPR